MWSDLVIKAVTNFGFGGLVFVIWFFTQRDRDKDRKIYEATANKALSQVQENVNDLKRMYENNIVLVKQYEQLAGNLQDVVIMNTQATTKLGQAIETNQFCPVKRNRYEPN